MRLTAVVVAALVASAAVGDSAPIRAQQSVIAGLLVAPFAGPEPLGRKTSTVLHLQIWQTLRRAPSPNPKNLSFRRGIVQWSEGAAPTRHSEALAQLPGSVSQMVLWGHAQEFGGGVIVQAYLSVAEPSGALVKSAGFWSVSVPRPGASDEVVSVGLPATVFEFGPVLLRAEVIPQLRTQIGIPIYKDRTFKKAIGTLTGMFEALEHAPNAAKVTSRGVIGWVALPGLSANRSEVTDFTGAMIRVFRQDWVGAIELLERVTRTDAVPTNVRIAAYLLMAAASHLSHRQTGSPDRSLQLVEAAERLNPYLPETVRYKCMALLALPDRSAGLRSVGETVRSKGYLFPKDDPWLATIRRIVASPSPKG